MVPAQTRTLVFVALILVFTLAPLTFVSLQPEIPRAVNLAWIAVAGAAGIVAYVGWSSRHVQFDLSPAGLAVRNSLFGKSIPRADLLPEEGRAVSLRDEPRLKPVLRTWGSGLIGYGEGWFRLRNRDKALLFLTDRTRVVDLPTRKGFRVLLSVDQPEEFLETARRIWGEDGLAAPPAPPPASIPR
jgi:hypothetical protein